MRNHTKVLLRGCAVQIVALAGIVVLVVWLINAGLSHLGNTKLGQEAESLASEWLSAEDDSTAVDMNQGE